MRNYLHINFYISHVPEASFVLQLRVGSGHIQSAHILISLRGQALLLYSRALHESPGINFRAKDRCSFSIKKNVKKRYLTTLIYRQTILVITSSEEPLCSIPSYFIVSQTFISEKKRIKEPLCVACSCTHHISRDNKKEGRSKKKV